MRFGESNVGRNGPVNEKSFAQDGSDVFIDGDASTGQVIPSGGVLRVDVMLVADICFAIV